MYIRFYHNTCDSSYYNHNIEIIGFLPIDVFIVEQNAMSSFFLLSGGSASADAWIFFFHNFNPEFYHLSKPFNVC